jgi:hypothetical protein
MEIDGLSAAEIETERFYGFGGHSVRPLGKKKLTWRARNGINGQLSGLAHKGQKRTTVFYVAPELRQGTPSSQMDGVDHYQPAIIFGKKTCRETGAVACRPILPIMKIKRKKTDGNDPPYPAVEPESVLRAHRRKTS